MIPECFLARALSDDFPVTHVLLKNLQKTEKRLHLLSLPSELNSSLLLITLKPRTLLPTFHSKPSISLVG